MTGAALALGTLDADAGLRALEGVPEVLLQRVDCMSMGEFVRAAGWRVPHVVLDLIPRIHDRRERAEATAIAAAALYGEDPRAALAAVHELERPADRSTAFLCILDRHLGISDLPMPQSVTQEPI